MRFMSMRCFTSENQANFCVSVSVSKEGKTVSFRAAPILVSVSVSGQYQHILMVLESVKYIIQVPILLFVQY